MRFVIYLLVLLITSSCNIDEVITAPEPNGNYRPATTDSVMGWAKVYEYTPAPGQFVGELGTGGFTGDEKSVADAIAYAEKRLAIESFVSLGGFGGYIVVGFDHSIDNGESYDFAVQGNAFNGSSEPGIVWVMQDENGDGLPNDTWYELAGSEASTGEATRNYSVTYFRPTEAAQPVRWVDSDGIEGQIDYLAQSHKQDSYYPQWITTDSYTLTGTKLQSRNYDKLGNGALWVLPAFDWGYADNYSEADWLPTHKAVNQFDISNAIDEQSQTVELEFIDFVKIQTACNGKSGHLGEISTEVCNIYDI